MCPIKYVWLIYQIVNRSSIQAFLSCRTRAGIHSCRLSCKDLAANACRRQGVLLAHVETDRKHLCCRCRTRNRCISPTLTLNQNYPNEKFWPQYIHFYSKNIFNKDQRRYTKNMQFQRLQNKLKKENDCRLLVGVSRKTKPI